MLFHNFKTQRAFVAVMLALGVAGAAHGQSHGYHPAKSHFAPPFPTPIRAAEGSVRSRQLTSLKIWLLSTIEYLQDKNNVYPDMSSAGAAKKALWPYVSGNKGGVDPVTKLWYQPNPYLSHKSSAVVSDPSKMVLFYEARPNADGTRAVGFADGHCALILVREWPRLKRMSHMP
jgi:hypothetical protein